MPRRAVYEALRTRMRPAYRSIAGALPLSARRRLLYTVGHGRLPRLRDPVRFTEKVNWRVVHDRRSLLSWTCDKLEMKRFAQERAGSLGIRVPRTLWSGSGLQELVGLSFPEDWVLKPNHRSGLVHFGSAGRPIESSIVEVTRNWLRDDQGVLLGEWAYSRAHKGLLIEEAIGDAGAPSDYKFFVFAGKVAAVQLDKDRFSAHSRTFYTANWEPLSVENRFPVATPEAPPRNLVRMLEVAEALGAPFDFMRIDLYSVGEDIFFGEVTPYPGGGVEPFRPGSFDTWLGSHWVLPALTLEDN